VERGFDKIDAPARHQRRDRAANLVSYDATHSGGGPKLVPVESLIAAGKAMREKVPRRLLAEWKRNGRAHDPIQILRAQDAGRLRDLLPIRYGRMLESPFAFYRGAAALMASDLARTPITGVQVQACGDCHLLNFGAFATPERHIIFDISDYDETLPGPWEWDIKRLAASFVLAARSIGLADQQGRDAAATTARSYRKTLRKFTEMNPLETWYARVTSEDFIKSVPKPHRRRVRGRVDKASARSGSELDFPKLAQVIGGQAVIRDAPPQIFHPEMTHAPEFWTAIDKVFSGYRDSLADDRRTLLDQYRVVDAALKVVGIGSVGRRCWIALLMSATNDPLALQFKEAVRSVLEPYAGKSAYAHHGQRVVMGQRLMQPASDVFLGWVSVSSPEGQRQFYVRQLRDAKIKPQVETFDAEMLSIYGKACGRVLARAHAKTGCQSTISGYLGTSDRFDEAMADFAVAYADQTERDYAALKTAVKRGRIKAYQG
jgi:uncharacterized protein (DUF2252 family)